MAFPCEAGRTRTTVWTMRKVLLVLFCGLLAGCSKRQSSEEIRRLDELEKRLTARRLNERFDEEMRAETERQNPPPESSTALQRLEKLAEEGSADAQFDLAGMYASGKDLPKDDVKAFEWYKKAAFQGHTGAQFKLAGIYANGIGTEKNENKAVDYLTKAATQGHAEAQFNLGCRIRQRQRCGARRGQGVRLVPESGSPR